MTLYNVTLTATLEHAPAEDLPPLVGRRWAEDAGVTLLGTHYRLDGEPRLGVAGALDVDEPGGQLAELRLQRVFGALVLALGALGLRVVRWDVIELLTATEAERRLEAAAVPPMVSAGELAELCGVTVQRIYELDGERRRAADAGEPHAFPAPVVSGWWLESVARTYAATRKRRPGPAPAPRRSA